jgi:hypothetical protein
METRCAAFPKHRPVAHAGVPGPCESTADQRRVRLAARRTANAFEDVEHGGWLRTAEVELVRGSVGYRVWKRYDMLRRYGAVYYTLLRESRSSNEDG